MKRKKMRNTKTVLASILMIGIVAMAVGAGTLAYFSDVETSSGNTFTAGTLDLSLTENTPLPFNVTNTYPGDSGSGTVNLTNGGSLSGLLDVKVNNTVNTESSGSTEYEADGDSGELGANAEMAIWLDVDQSGSITSGDIGLNSSAATYDPTTGLQYDTMDNYNGDVWNDIRTMTSSDVDVFNVTWNVPTSTGNDIQGDSVSFDVYFQLRQSGAGGF